MTHLRSRSYLPKKRRGFILVMTLFVLAIVGLLLISLANHSMVTATDAKMLRKETARKWAHASTQQYVLNQIDSLLSKTDEEDNQQLERENQFSIRLNDTEYRVYVADESAKLDVNHIYENQTRRQATQTIRQMLPVNTRLRIRLRPNTLERQDAITRPFEGWGQVFGFDEWDYHTIPQEMATATGRLTCWSPKLNALTADDETLLESAKLLVGGVVADRLVAARSRSPDGSLADWIEQSNGTASQKQALRSHLSNRSWCQSISIRPLHAGQSRTTQLYRRFYTESIFRIHSYRW